MIISIEFHKASFGKVNGDTLMLSANNRWYTWKLFLPKLMVVVVIKMFQEQDT